MSKNVSSTGCTCVAQRVHAKYNATEGTERGQSKEHAEATHLKGREDAPQRTGSQKTRSMPSERIPTWSGDSAALNVLPASLSASASVSSELCDAAEGRRRARRRVAMPTRGEVATAVDELASASSSSADLSSDAPGAGAESSSRAE